MRIPAPQTRIDIFWIAAALVVGVGVVAGATASSSARVDTATTAGALHGVTAVSVAVGGTARPAALAHNAFSFSDEELGGTAGVTGEVVATMGDGTTREAPFHVDSFAHAPAAP